MDNWLEAEEHKKAVSLQREQAVHEQLKTFYDLCNRVNDIRPNSLSINWLRAESTRTYTIRKTESDDDGGSMGLWGKRGIRISCPAQDETFIEVVINEHHHHIDRVCGDISSDREKVVTRKTCSIQGISDWREDQILQAIRWMMLESDTINDSIPGVEVVTEEAVAEAKASLERANMEAAERAAQGARSRAEQEKGSGCFVATAAYGARDPHVIVLGAYRDLILGKTFVGRSVVRLYYLASPPLARFIQASNYRQAKARALLGPFVLLARRRLHGDFTRYDTPQLPGADGRL
jgi:hypothetical protein